MLRWVSNTYDPKRDSRDPSKREWLEDKLIGWPSATVACTVQELAGMHMVGVYVEEDDERES